MPALVVAILILIADLISKLYAVVAIPETIYNDAPVTVLGLLSIVVVIAFAAVSHRIGLVCGQYASGLLLGGALGNLFFLRLASVGGETKGGVPDMIPIGEGWMVNVADLAILGGEALAVLAVVELLMRRFSPAIWPSR